MFSNRIRINYSNNSLFRMLSSKESSAIKVLDLTESNPTRAGFRYREAQILKSMVKPANLQYEPVPRGLLNAREAVGEYYRKHGKQVRPESLFLTSGTSEAYSYLIKLLCNSGDEVLYPVPSYPLLEPLAELEAVRPVGYPVRYHAGRWSIDIDSLKASISTRTKAVIAVSPNNPTGSYLTKRELSEISRLCFEHEMALVVDEVFLDYAAPKAKRICTAGAENRNALTFVLSGLSKILALPQLKLGWIQVSGPVSLRRRASEQLEFIADTYLSVNSMVQYAARELFFGQDQIKNQIQERILNNEAFLLEKIGEYSGITVLTRQGGWYAVLKIPNGCSDEETALELLKKESVLVHPGYFYGFREEGHLILSLITKPEIFKQGILRIISSCSK